MAGSSILGRIAILGGGAAFGLLVWRLVTRQRAEAPEGVRYVDLERFLGTWYEIARYPTSFEAGRQATSASFLRNRDGQLELVYRCRRKSLDGPSAEARGRVNLLDPISNSQLRVRFRLLAPLDLSVIDLGEDYDYAVLGDARRRHLWLLSRMPHLDEATLDGILGRLSHHGYDAGRLEWPQQPPAAGTGRLPAMGQAPLPTGP